jgi:peptide chain release factor subunit 1
MKKLLNQLSSKQGRGTELVSLYVPSNKALHEVINNLKEEYGTASNIKSDTTRNHVQDALTKTQQRLKLYRKTPDNGIVIFAGAIPGDGPPGSEVVEVYEILPHQQVQNYLYRCDDHFHLSYLREMLKEKNVIGILSLDTSEAGLGIVSGNNFETIQVLTSGVSGKHRAGGQSARRFERLRDMELTQYYHRIADNAKKTFIEDYKTKGLIVSGPGPTKNNFLKEEYLDYRLQKNILAVFDTSYSGEEGIRETIEKSDKVLVGVRVMEEKQLVQNFLREVNKEGGLAVYGIKEIEAGLSNSSIETILVSEDIDLIFLKSQCKNCAKEESRLVSRDKYIETKQNLVTNSCSECGNQEQEIVEKDFIEYIADISVDSGAKVEVISSNTEEGRMLKSFGGVAAILRFKQIN